MANDPGFLITLEGGEGGGKTTQIPKLQQKLIDAGYDVLMLREPGGTAVSEQIREVVLSAKNVGAVAFTTEVFLYQAARAQIYDELVIPALKAGRVVIMDRSRDSSVVYQGIVRGFGKELIDQLNNVSTQNTFPDMTLLLDVTVETGLARRAQTEEFNRLDMESVAFHQKVRDAYLEIARDFTKRWAIIDANQEVDQVEKDIWAEVQNRMSPR
jgi:dTMP kinase